jgi:hypothetical protein
VEKGTLVIHTAPLATGQATSSIVILRAISPDVTAPLLLIAYLGLGSGSRLA